MSEPGGQDILIERLVADLAPVRRLPRPAMRTVIWLAVVLALAVACALFSDITGMRHRLAGSPDLLLAFVGSAATAVLAAFAAFELGLPDRSRRWALLPFPALALWIGASGLGCARSWLVPGTHAATPGEMHVCMMFITGLSVPLSIGMLAMLRRGCSLSPTLTSVIAGLAVAASAATLLDFFHPYDATAEDLAVHGVAVLLVIGANRLAGGRLLSPRTPGR